MTRPQPAWSLRPATADDLEPLADLRAVVLRPDLERLDRYDEHRVRQRLRDGFTPAHTRIIEINGARAGSIALRPTTDRHWLEHFYLAPHHQGAGIGSAVLRSILAEADAVRTTLTLNVLQGSPARRLYARYGFVVESEDAVDVFMVRKFL